MAQRSHTMTSVFHLDGFRAFILYILFSGTLAIADSGSVVYAAQTNKEPGFGRIRHLGSSVFEIVFQFTKQRLLRTINGQIGLWDIVQLITAYGVVHAIRGWKNRKEVHHKSNDHSDCSALSGCNSHKYTETLSQRDSENMKAGKYNVF